MLMFSAPYFDTLSEANGKKPLFCLREKETASIEDSRLVAFLCPIYMNHTGFVQAFARQ